jgi:hypothetical protein
MPTGQENLKQDTLGTNNIKTAGNRVARPASLR